MCSIIGRPTSGSIGLGRFDVCGRSRVPSPPAMMTAFMRGSVTPASASAPAPASPRAARPSRSALRAGPM